jgi:hypothetical protein
MPATTSALRVVADMGNQRRKGSSAWSVVFMGVSGPGARHHARVVPQFMGRVV